MSAAPVPRAVDPASFTRLPSRVLPMPDLPNCSADLANPLAPDTTLTPLATWFARLSQPAIGIAIDP